jgi:3-deoxy-D-manno-octulosonic-acid transferase
VLLAGCTHPGEEEIVLSAFRQVKDQISDVRLIIAPRDISRAPKVEELAAEQGFTSTRCTKIESSPPESDAVIILDTIGELSRVYAICSSAFVGGSLTPNGGHNVLEPLGMGKPALFGPHMENFRDIAALTRQQGVGFQIATAEELAACWLRLLRDPALCETIASQSRQIFRQYTGASDRCAEEALKLVTR